MTPRRRPKLRAAEGAVTILMTVVFLLILSLVLVSLESARQQSLTAMTKLSAQSAAESVLGSYYAPLFDEYGLYGIYDTDIGEELRRYAEASARPENDAPLLYSGERTSHYSYAYDVADVALTRSVSLLYGGAAICRNQMMEAGAVSGVQELAEMLLRAVRLLRDSETAAEALEYQQRVERELSKTDAIILKLMTVLDGIPTDENGVKLASDGTFTPENKFVKRAVPGAVTAAGVHMNNASFFRQLESKYVDIQATAAAFLRNLEALPTEEVPVEVAVDSGRILYGVLDSLDPMDEAIRLLDELIKLQETGRPLVEEYAEYIETVKPLVGEDFYDSLHDSLGTMRKYVGTGSDGAQYCFREMQQTLIHNRVVLYPWKEKLLSMPRTKSQWIAIYSGLMNAMKDYSLDWLEIDYSGVKISTQTSSFWSVVKSVITNGIVGGLYGDDITISRASLPYSADRPSGVLFGSLADLYSGPVLPAEGTVSRSFLERVLEGNLFGALLDELADGVVALSEKLLLVSYMATHMTSFEDAERKGVLHYEQEYLLFGERSDADNQRSTTRRILGLRAVMNTLHVFTDSAKKAEALLIATELLSLLPFPLLIKITQYIILLVWGIQNAYLETAELLRGKAVPVLVTADSFQLTLGEAFTMTKDKRLAAARNYQSPTGFCMRYPHYLLLLMMLTNADKLTMRALDIIQMNIAAGYDPKFLLKDCIYGFDAEITVVCPTLFTDLLGGSISSDTFGTYEITEKCAASY